MQHQNRRRRNFDGLDDAKKLGDFAVACLEPPRQGRFAGGHLPQTFTHRAKPGLEGADGFSERPHAVACLDRFLQGDGGLFQLLRSGARIGGGITLRLRESGQQQRRYQSDNAFHPSRLFPVISDGFSSPISSSSVGARSASRPLESVAPSGPPTSATGTGLSVWAV